MTRSEIGAIVTEVAARELGTTPEGLPERVEALDSIERMQLAVAVEDRFHIRLDTRDEAMLYSLAEVVELIHQKLDGGAPS